MTRYKASSGTTRRPADVLAAVEKFAAGVQDGKFTSLDVKMAVLKELHGGTLTWDGPLEGQIGRAVEKLVKAGTLIKIARGDYGPDGKRSYRWPVYWRPDEYQAAEAATAERQVTARKTLDRWHRIRDSLEDLGFASLAGVPLVLSQAQWEQLIGLARTGRDWESVKAEHLRIHLDRAAPEVSVHSEHTAEGPAGCARCQLLRDHGLPLEEAARKLREQEGL